MSGILLLWEPHLENFMSQPNVIPIFRHRHCKTGAGTSFGTNGDPIAGVEPPLLIFCALTIRKQSPKTRFERKCRGQGPPRGHKFLILENSVLHWDVTSQTLASFPSDLVGACLPQTLLAKLDETSILQKILLLIKLF